MPINEILAPCYTITRYTTPHYLAGHTLRLYFSVEPVFTVGGEAYFPSYTDASHPTGYKLTEILEEIGSRLSSSNLPLIEFVGSEIWRSVPDSPNEFIAYDGGDYSAISVGSGTGIASAYVMLVLKAANRQQFRLTMFDTKVANPQGTLVAVPPDIDDGSLTWFMLKSDVEFCTQDGERLTIPSSFNTGYNRRLARSYGRQLTP